MQMNTLVFNAQFLPYIFLFHHTCLFDLFLIQINVKLQAYISLNSNYMLRFADPDPPPHQAQNLYIAFNTL